MHLRTVRPDDAIGDRLSTGQLADASLALLGLLAGVDDEPESLLDELEELDESDELDEPVDALEPEPEPDLGRLSVR
jgi:hypothetical protein